MKNKDMKVTICPPAPQEIFFQEIQFDPTMREGTNPIRYLQGQQPHKSSEKSPKYGNKAQKTKLKKAEKELEGHENKEEILKILRSGL